MIDTDHLPPTQRIYDSFLGTMRWFRVLCFFVCALLNVQRTVAAENAVFWKCCPRNQSLVKVTKLNNPNNKLTADAEITFECVHSASALEKYNVTHFSQIIISDDMNSMYGIPQNCALEMTPINEVDLVSNLNDIICYDKVILEVVDGTIVQNIPKIVAVACVQNEPETLQVDLNVELFRKCCPTGQAYDTQYHVCREMNDESTTEWVLTKFNMNVDGYVLDVETGLNCKSEEYSVELTTLQFGLDVEGSVLNVLDGSAVTKVSRGDWCVDRDYKRYGLVARVCTKDCSLYSAFCFRKCCPVGEHYLPLRCGSSRSKCVPSNGIGFNMSYYLDPLKVENENLLDVQGIRAGLKCPAGKFALNRSLPGDRHWLGTNGLEGSSWDPLDYCIETFDYRFCPGGEITILPLVCFVPETDIPEKNYLIAAVSNSISAVFLILTLLVYLSLPELQNLHGRTVICHSLTMLFAYSCLARAQFDKVDDASLCIFLGYGIYFGFVGSFVWLNVMCFDIWWTFGNIRSIQPMRKASFETKRFIAYAVYAWGLTLTFTVVLFLFDTFPVSSLLKANMGRDTCWFGYNQSGGVSKWPHYIFFVIPMGILTSVNLVLWILTARHCAAVKSEVHRMQAGSIGERAKKRFRLNQAKYLLTGKLWVVMGAGWISELLSTVFTEPSWLWAGVDLINQLQGLFVFIILVFKPKIYNLCKKRLGLEVPDPQKNGTLSSGRTSSTFLSRSISNDDRYNLRRSLSNNTHSLYNEVAKSDACLRH